jgi:hypothetical protein
MQPKAKETADGTRDEGRPASSHPKGVSDMLDVPSTNSTSAQENAFFEVLFQEEVSVFSDALNLDFLDSGEQWWTEPGQSRRA